MNKNNKKNKKQIAGMSSGGTAGIVLGALALAVVALICYRYYVKYISSSQSYTGVIEGPNTKEDLEVTEHMRRAPDQE